MAEQPSPRPISRKFQFPDVYLPADVVKALVYRTITPLGFLILMVVRALTIRKKWCWANNRYFAAACGRSSRDKISRAIKNLVDLGFLIQRLKNDRRYLRLAWSWHLSKRVRPPTLNDKSAPTQNGKYKQRTVEAKETNGRASEADPLSDQLYTAIHAWMKREGIGGTKPACSKGPHWLSKTIKKHGLEETKRVLAWTLERLGEPYIPEVRSAETFHRKFDALVFARHRLSRKQVAKDEDVIN